MPSNPSIFSYSFVPASEREREVAGISANAYDIYIPENLVTETQDMKLGSIRIELDAGYGFLQNITQLSLYEMTLRDGDTTLAAIADDLAFDPIRTQSETINGVAKTIYYFDLQYSSSQGFDYEALTAQNATFDVTVHLSGGALHQTGLNAVAFSSQFDLELSFHVDNVDEAVMFENPVELISFNVDENTPADTQIGRVTAIDPEGQAITYQIEGAGRENFSIQNDGTIVLANSLDFETQGTYNLIIAAFADDGHAPAQQQVRVAVNDLIDDGDSLTIDASAAGAGAYSDTDGIGKVFTHAQGTSYSVAASDGSAIFELIDGVLFIVDDADVSIYDAVYQLTARATDSNDDTVMRSFSVIFDGVGPPPPPPPSVEYTLDIDGAFAAREDAPWIETAGAASLGASDGSDPSASETHVYRFAIDDITTSEDGTTSTSTISSADAEIGADGRVGIKGIYGTLYGNTDGSWSYELDNDDSDTESLHGRPGEDGNIGVETIRVTLTRTLADGTSETMVQSFTINVTGLTDYYSDGPETSREIVGFSIVAEETDEKPKDEALEIIYVDPTTIDKNAVIAPETLVLHGRGGSDMLFGGGGDDVIYGGGGWDALTGGAGDDVLIGGRGRNIAHYVDKSAGSAVVIDLASATRWKHVDGAWSASDTAQVPDDNRDDNSDDARQTFIRAAIDNDGDGTADEYDYLRDIDDLVGGSGADEFTGDAEVNAFSGGAGDDTLDGGEGNDALAGDAGDDTVSGGAGIDLLSGADGNDIVAGDADTDLIWGGAGDDTLNGGDGDDFIKGGSGDDTISGDDGDDSLYGNGGTDTIDGGNGTDTVAYDHAKMTWVLSSSGNLIGYSRSIAATQQRVTVNLGDDTKWKYENDTWVSGEDESFTYVRAAIDYDGDGTADEYDYLINVENLGGSEGNDFFVGDESANHFKGGAGDDRLYGGAGDDTLYGGAGDDTIGSGAGANILYGGDGDDFVLGGLDDDRIEGGADNDILYGDAGENIFDGGTGTDTLTFTRRSNYDFTLIDSLISADAVISYIVSVDLADDTKWRYENDAWISGETESFTYARAAIDYDGDGTADEYDYLINVENLRGSEGDDRLDGDAGDNVLDGDQGDDMLLGNAGDDRLYGDTGDDRLYGGGDDDRLEGDTGDDHLYGGAGEDIIEGGAGADTLAGGKGRDVLIGDDGRDWWVASDIFVLNQGETITDDDVDIVLDFNRFDGDKIRVDVKGADIESLDDIRASANIRWETVSDYDESTYDLLGENFNSEDIDDTLIYDTYGTANEADDTLLMVLEDYEASLTLDNFDII